jgi:dihydroorotase-like cyclic amidohydrolase
VSSLLVTGARVVTATDGYQADVLVRDGKVAMIGASLQVPADTILDAPGCLLLPGGVDPHTHLASRLGSETATADDFGSGTVAAAISISAATHQMNVDYSLYEGWHLTGSVRTVISGGSPVVENGVFVGKPGTGQFLRGEASGQP